MTKILASLALLSLLIAPARAADLSGKTPVRTVSIGDVTIEIAGSDGASVAQIAASNGAAAGNGLFILGATYNSSLPTNTSGRSVTLQTDVNGRLLVTQDASAGALLTNLTKVGGSSVALGSTTGSASIPVVIASDQGNLPSNIKQVNGSTLSLGQTTMANSLPVAIASNQGALSTTVGAPTGSSWNKAAVSNIAAAGTTAIACKTGITVSQATKPLQYVITAAGAVRCQLRYNDNGSFTNFTDVVVTPGQGTAVWTPPTGIIGLTTSATSTTQQYEANCTNFDAVAQDVGCTIVYCSAASGC